MTDQDRIAKLTDRDRELNSFAFRAFRDVADADYIAGRMAYRAQLPVQFLWASQQALEKYLKCILFIRRVPATNVKHNLDRALKLIETANIPLDLSSGATKFIKYIDSVGQYRYMEASFFVTWSRILELDQTIWELRRFCTLDPRVTSAKLVEGKVAPRVRIGGGYLEQIIDAGRANPAREQLVWNNGYFGRSRKKVTVWGSFTAVNSPLLKVDLLDDVLQFAYIPDGVVKAYRNAAKQRQQGKP